NKKSYNAEILEPKLINAWGVAIRPAGAGGHFWVLGKDISFEYIGDVKQSSDKAAQKLHTDSLKTVHVPTGSDEAFATSTVFLDTKDNFVITQDIEGADPITAGSKFIFASD